MTEPIRKTRAKRMQASWAVGFGKGRFVFFVGLFYMA